MPHRLGVAERASRHDREARLDAPARFLVPQPLQPFQKRTATIGGLIVPELEPHCNFKFTRAGESPCVIQRGAEMRG